MRRKSAQNSKQWERERLKKEGSVQLVSTSKQFWSTWRSDGQMWSDCADFFITASGHIALRFRRLDRLLLLSFERYCCCSVPLFFSGDVCPIALLFLLISEILLLVGLCTNMYGRNGACVTLRHHSGLTWWTPYPVVFPFLHWERFST